MCAHLGTCYVLKLAWWWLHEQPKHVATRDLTLYLLTIENVVSGRKYTYVLYLLFVVNTICKCLYIYTRDYNWEGVWFNIFVNTLTTTTPQQTSPLINYKHHHHCQNTASFNTRNPDINANIIYNVNPYLTLHIHYKDQSINIFNEMIHNFEMIITHTHTHTPTYKDIIVSCQNLWC